MSSWIKDYQEYVSAWNDRHSEYVEAWHREVKDFWRDLYSQRPEPVTERRIPDVEADGWVTVYQTTNPLCDCAPLEPGETATNLTSYPPKCGRCRKPLYRIKR